MYNIMHSQCGYIEVVKDCITMPVMRLGLQEYVCHDFLNYVMHVITRNELHHGFLHESFLYCYVIWTVYLSCSVSDFTCMP